MKAQADFDDDRNTDRETRECDIMYEEDIRRVQKEFNEHNFSILDRPFEKLTIADRSG